MAPTNAGRAEHAPCGGVNGTGRRRARAVGRAVALVAGDLAAVGADQMLLESGFDMARRPGSVTSYFTASATIAATHVGGEERHERLDRRAPAAETAEDADESAQHGRARDVAGGRVEDQREPDGEDRVAEYARRVTEPVVHASDRVEPLDPAVGATLPRSACPSSRGWPLSGRGGVRREPASGLDRSPPSPGRA